MYNILCNRHMYSIYIHYNPPPYKTIYTYSTYIYDISIHHIQILYQVNSVHTHLHTYIHTPTYPPTYIHTYTHEYTRVHTLTLIPLSF